MTHIWQGLRSGRWLTAERARGYSLILLGALCDRHRRLDRAVGRADRSQRQAGRHRFFQLLRRRVAGAGRAGRRRLSHGAAACPRTCSLWRPRGAVYGWLIRRFFFAVARRWCAALPLCADGLGAILPYLASHRGVSGGAARDAVARPETPLIAPAFPAVFVNLGHGQNGFLTAALLGGALAFAAIGGPGSPACCSACSPTSRNSAVLIPVALLAGGRWRTIGRRHRHRCRRCSRSASRCFGSDVWHAFAASTEIHANVLLEQGDIGWEKSKSSSRRCGCGAAACRRLRGAGRAGARCSPQVWRVALAKRMPRSQLKAAALATGSLLASPLCARLRPDRARVAIAFLVRHGLQ